MWFFRALSFTKSCIAMVERVGLEAQKNWGANCKEAHPTATQALSLTGPCVQKICFLLMWAFRAFSISKVALVTRRGFPLAAAAAAMQAVFVGWSCAARKSSAGKKIVRQGKKTRLQSSIRTNARKCLPPRQETLQNRQKRQSRSRLAGNQAKN